MIRFRHKKMPFVPFFLPLVTKPCRISQKFARIGGDALLLQQKMRQPCIFLLTPYVKLMTWFNGERLTKLALVASKDVFVKP